MALVFLNFFEISNQVRTATSTLMQSPEIFGHRFTLERKLYELSAYCDAYAAAAFRHKMNWV